VTVDLASPDAYATSTEATVVEQHLEGVVLDRTVFHPRGGGLPGDGVLRWAQGGCVRSTAEVGALRVVKTESKGKANKRMRIELVDR
jgi:Ser-tRNA(Ala) deacylase AlaX